MRAHRVLAFSCAVLLGAAPCACAKAVAAPAAFKSEPGFSEETIGKKLFEVARVQVKASPQKVWEILTDYNKAPAIFENLKKCEVLENKGTTKTVRHVVHPGGYPGTFNYILEVKETAPRTLEWHRLSGDFKEVDGFWKLEPVSGGLYTNVTYCAYVNGGLFLPGCLIRGQMKDDMPGVLIALRNEAESIPTQMVARR